MNTISKSRPFQLRRYQERIVNECWQTNSIVLLPTGAGKTAIAADLISRVLDLHNERGSSRAVLFLVPTCLLVEQQALALRGWLSSNVKVAENQGGIQFPKIFDVLVSTPESFRRQLSVNVRWSRFAHVVFDEVHHVLKEHPYRHIALNLKDWVSRSVGTSSPEPPCVLGLSASLSYGIKKDTILASVKRLSRELNIKHMARATEEEMARDGYCVARSATKVMCIAEEKTAEGVVPESERKPHLMGSIFWKRVKADTCTPFASELVNLAKAVEELIEKPFVSPLLKGKLSSWGTYANRQARKLQKSHKSSSAYQVLEHLYEALRLLIVGWEEHNAQMLAKRYLQMAGLDTIVISLPPALQKRSRILLDFRGLECFHRFDLLKAELLKEKKERADSFRAVVFVQQRLVTHILAYLLDNDVELHEAGIKATWIYAASTPATASYKLSPTQAKENLLLFREGRVSVLFATAAAEEGMDVPEANVQINFDASLTPVSHTQRKGRARQDNSSTIVLSERRDRPTKLLEEMVAMQNEIVGEFKPNRDTTEEIALERVAQQSRERGAATLITSSVPELKVVLGVLNQYKTKTKANLTEHVAKKKGIGAVQFECTLRYTSCLREVLGRGVASTKKEAKQRAAQDCIRELSSSLKNV